jgi:signal transduction histidine kinase/ActR/RegA family two-component response regulator
LGSRRQLGVGYPPADDKLSALLTREESLTKPMMRMHRSFIDRLLLPAIFGLTTLIAGLVLWQSLVMHRRIEISAATGQQASFLKTEIETELEARILPLERLAGRWQVRDRADQPDMQSDAGLVMSSYPAYQAIEWVDPTFHVVWVTPETPNRASIGENLGADPSERTTLENARDQKNTMVTPPANLHPGVRGFLVCVPVFSNNQLTGFLVGEFRYRELLSSILQNVAPDDWVAVYDGDEEIYRRVPDPPPLERPYAQESSIKFQQLTWRAQAWPKSGAVAYARSPLPALVFGGDILIAIALAFAVYMAESSQLHVKKLAAANRELEKEIAGREQAEEALRHAQKMEAIGRLAGGVAHDFNNLLLVIRGQAALSLNGLRDGTSLRRELTEIVKAADRASSLTRKLLALGRKQVLQERVLDLNALVTQVAEMLPSVLGADITLKLDLDPGLGRVKADSAQLEQIIMNLVFNARDAMPDGGALTIETSNRILDDEWVRSHPEILSGPYVRLAVRDTGHGMDEETQAHLFEPFFTTKDQSKGSGLGMATVHGTVNQSGGCVTVSSKVGSGTTIRIYLPRVTEAVEAVEAAEPLDRSLVGKERILVVEDDDAVRRMTLEFLKIRGYTLIEARSATDAIQLVERHEDNIDLVLTDVVMPGMKGRELVNRLEKIRPGLKVLYMSAYTEDDAVNIGILSPGTSFIEKPFSPDQLAAKVREVLGHAESKTEAQTQNRGAQI